MIVIWSWGSNTIVLYIAATLNNVNDPHLNVKMIVSERRANISYTKLMYICMYGVRDPGSVSHCFMLQEAQV